MGEDHLDSAAVVVELRTINEKLTQMVEWQQIHSGERSDTAHGRIGARLEEHGLAIARTRTIFGAVTTALGAAWAGLLVWWKS